MKRFGLRVGVVSVCGLLMATASGGSAAALSAAGKTLGIRSGVNTISCAAAGDCAAAGFYGRKALHEAFVVGETDGAWRNPVEVPGTEPLSTRGFNTRTSSRAQRPVSVPPSAKTTREPSWSMR